VALDAVGVDHWRREGVAGEVQIRAGIEALSNDVAGEVERGGRVEVLPLDAPHDAGQLDVAAVRQPLAVLGRDVGNRETRLEIGRVEDVAVDALIPAGAGTLERDGEAGVALD